MKLESRNIGEWRVLTPDQERLDACVSEELKQSLLEQIESGPQLLVLDISKVEFMDSSGLGAVVFCLQRMNSDGRIALAGAQDSVALMLRLTHMDRVFTVVDTPEDVVAPQT